jgi:hypothetical protein
VDVGGPTGRAENVSGFLEVLLADASWAPHVHPLAVEPRAGEQDDGKPAVPRLDPGLGAACSDPVRAQAASHRNVARLYQSAIGPFGEDAAVAMTVAEMQAANAGIHAIAGKRRYPDSSHVCDLALGALPDWAIEVKLARLARQESFANSWPIAGGICYVPREASRIGEAVTSRDRRSGEGSDRRARTEGGLFMRIRWLAWGSSTQQLAVEGSAGRGLPRRWRSWRMFLVPAIGIAVIAQLSLAGSATMAAATTAKTLAAAGSVAPKPVNELDCNGWSAKYQTVRQLAGDLCTDPIKVLGGKGSRFVDNGWYIGHDEPSVKFISGAPGSGNTMTYLTKVPVDPAKAPTASGSVTNYGQLSIAPWFGLPICDPKSSPQNPCIPDSDSNTGSGLPTDAGSAFMELQLYPPGYTPFVDNISCSATKWCAALNIDSVECDSSGACNNDCIEPVNFAFLQTNGVPAGPPSPQLADVSTFLPNARTLMINPGDVLQVSITDPPRGFTTTIRDLSNGKTGFMTASAANGFMNTNIADCSGTPFTFHAEYSTASIQNRVPWAALEGGVLMQQEIGHSEVCKSLKNNDPFNFSSSDGQTFSDPKVFDTCVGGSEGSGQVGEGPCLATGCQNAETQGPNGPVACPTNDPASGALCEFADGNCFTKGTRTVTINGVATLAESAANQCFDNRFQNGDLDFDGL